MLAIDEAMVRIQQIQQDLAITQIQEVVNGNVSVRPLAIAVKRAYPYFPPQSASISDSPCFINAWTAPEATFHSALQSGNFSVHMQLLVNDANTDRAAAIASAFYPEVLAAFAANLKLGGWSPATVKSLRGGDPTLTVLDFAGKTFVGLDLFLDIALNGAQLMAA